MKKNVLVILLVCAGIVTGVLWAQDPVETKFEALSSLLMNLATFIGLLDVSRNSKNSFLYTRIEGYHHTKSAIKNIILVEICLSALLTVLGVFKITVDPTFHINPMIVGIMLWTPGVILSWELLGLVGDIVPDDIPELIRVFIGVIHMLPVAGFIWFFMGVYIPEAFQYFPASLWLSPVWIVVLTIGIYIGDYVDITQAKVVKVLTLLYNLLQKTLIHLEDMLIWIIEWTHSEDGAALSPAILGGILVLIALLVEPKDTLSEVFLILMGIFGLMMFILGLVIYMLDKKD